MATLGTKIRKVRELRSLSQESVAQQMGISQSTYSRYEIGESEITQEVLSEIASVLNVKKEFIESFDENIYFNNHLNSVSDQAKANLLGNYCATVNQYLLGEEMEELFKKTIKLQEDKIALLEDKIFNLEEKLKER